MHPKDHVDGSKVHPAIALNRFIRVVNPKPPEYGRPESCRQSVTEDRFGDKAGQQTHADKLVIIGKILRSVAKDAPVVGVVITLDEEMALRFATDVKRHSG